MWQFQGLTNGYLLLVRIQHHTKAMIPPKTNVENNDFIEIYLQEYEWGVTYRHMGDSKSIASPKSTPRKGDHAKKKKSTL